MTDLDLRTTLHRVAEGSTPLPVADDLWQRGQAARRRARAYVLAAVLVVVTSIGGTFALVDGDREARTASGDVTGGAIPSVIEDVPAWAFEDDYAIGRAAVAYIDNTADVVVSAEDGRSHHFGTGTRALALSPDGWRLAWATPGSVHVADLDSGDVTDLALTGAELDELSWLADSDQLRWSGRQDGEVVAGVVDTTRPSTGMNLTGRAGFRGMLSPGGDLFALSSDAAEVTAAPFARPGGERVERPLPTDLYPDGAVVAPAGWASDTLVVAMVDPPQTDVVERPRLAIFTAPNRPESEWVYREFLFRLPPASSLTVATDLIPDLTGDPDQELTHDFAADSRPEEERDVSWIIGIGVAAAIGVLLGLRWLWRRYRTVGS